jgi:hypothetical protein
MKNKINKRSYASNTTLKSIVGNKYNKLPDSTILQRDSQDYDRFQAGWRKKKEIK